jgi:hypothetical protein
MDRTPLSPDEIEARMPAIGIAMKHHTFPHTSAIYGVFDENHGELVGSGTFVMLFGETFLLTAMHVAAAKLALAPDGSGRKYVGLAHSMASGDPPQPLTALCFGIPHPYDLCIIPVDGTALGDRKPVTIEAFASDADEAEHDLLFVQGFPADKSRSLFGVHSQTYPYVTTIGECTRFDWFDQKLHIAVDYASSGLKDELGNPTDVVDPHGMSGSAIWATGRTSTGDNWTPAKAKIVGVVHNWDDKAGSLVGTRIEIVYGFLLHVLRSRLAYQKWQERGSPANDDWNDWFKAVDAIPRLRN